MNPSFRIMLHTVLLIAAVPPAAFGEGAADVSIAIYFNPIRGESVGAYGYEGTKMALEDI